VSMVDQAAAQTSARWCGAYAACGRYGVPELASSDKSSSGGVGATRRDVGGSSSICGRYRGESSKVRGGGAVVTGGPQRFI
jgi:hypothetical protein